jgi:chromosome segregation protein
MHLKSITLSGFKSFADKTKLPLTTDITAVVGPNGCGKSNVIDAMRWVIGETSAKQLRGGSMADVIFNGAGTRPSGAKASVELLLDNSDKRLLGEYAAYNEIAIRREVLRDGQSKYLINGTVCRRRDVMDLFLGTGLGPRSYSIIEQGMISKLIEAKPEELRVYIEEAAGISKYKERRRETSNRMRNTTENCERLEDMRLELDKRLNHLKRQASSAKRYNALKEEEKVKQVELHALRWHKLAAEINEINSKLESKETIYQSHKADKAQFETEMIAARLQQSEMNEALQEVQKKYYAHETEIARLQQQIQNLENNIYHFTEELQRAEQHLQSQGGMQVTQSNRLLHVQQEIIAHESKTSAIAVEASSAAAALAAAENSMREWRNQWDDVQIDYSEAIQQLNDAKNKLQRLEDRSEQCLLNIANIKQELDELNSESFSSEITNAECEITELKLTKESYLADISRCEIVMRNLQDANNVRKQQLPTMRGHLSQTQGKLTAMRALQQASLGHFSENTQEWLSANGLAANQCVLDKLTVQDGYAIAVEMVLYDLFDAICISDWGDVKNKISAMPAGIMFLNEQDLQNNSQATEEFSHQVLARFVNAPWSALEVLQRVWVAETTEQAFAMRAELPKGFSVITKEGVWLSANWMKKTKCQEEDQNLLNRQQLIVEHEEEVANIQDNISCLENEIESTEVAMHDARKQRDDIQYNLQQANIQIATINTKLDASKKLQDQSRVKISNFIEKLNRLEQESEENAISQSEFAEHAAQYAQELMLLEERKSELQSGRELFDEALVAARERQQESYQSFEQHKFSLKSKQDECSLLENSLQQISEQCASLNAQIATASAKLSESRAPLDGYKDSLKQHMHEQSAVEVVLREHEARLVAVGDNHLALEKKVRELEGSLVDARSSMESLKLNQASIQARQQTIEEQLQTFETNLAAIILPEEANIAAWDKDLAEIQNKIHRLGAINLAAIDEYAELEERKIYLDRQYDDLMQALELLGSAIAKIDRETKVKFKYTYDKLNAAFQQIFPRVFSGGSAALSLTSDDLLSAGVTVHAQPPGKKNTSIHLLSGGEKAMTAVSLVFALFQLNPAPICILDEVDAPLDDANVNRFIQIVREMSKAVQFIVISHNKLTIAACDNLLGVTMKEAGVSRLVSVNLDQATAMVD